MRGRRLGARPIRLSLIRKEEKVAVTVESAATGKERLTRTPYLLSFRPTRSCEGELLARGPRLIA